MTTDQTTPLTQYLQPLFDYRRLVAAVTIGAIVLGVVVGVTASKAYSSDTAILVYPIAGDPTKALEADDTEVEMATELRVATSKAVIDVVAEKLEAQGIQLSPQTIEDRVTASTTKESRILDITFEAGAAAVAQAGAAAFADSYLEFRAELANSNKLASEAEINARIVVLKEQLSEVTTRFNAAPENSSTRVILGVEERSISGELGALQAALADLSTLTVDATRVIDPANLPDSPSGLTFFQILIGSIAAGIVLGVVSAYVIAAFTGANQPHNRRIADKQTPQLMESVQSVLATLASAAPGDDDSSEAPEEALPEASDEPTTAAAPPPTAASTPASAPSTDARTDVETETESVRQTQAETRAEVAAAPPPPPPPAPPAPTAGAASGGDTAPKAISPLAKKLQAVADELGPVAGDLDPSADEPAPQTPGPAPTSELSQDETPELYDSPIPAALQGPLDAMDAAARESADGDASDHGTADHGDDHGASTSSTAVGAAHGQPTPPTRDKPKGSIDTMTVSGNMEELIGALQMLGTVGPVVALSVGETSGATALAVAFDLAGELHGLGAKVLIVDAAVKDPMLHSLLRVEAGPGLADVLDGTKTLDEAVQPLGGLEGLDALTIGTIDDGTVDAMTGPALRELLEFARTEYHSILLVSGTVHDDGSMPALAANSDGMILSTGLAPGERISGDLCRRLDDLPVPTLDVVSTASQIAEAIVGTSGM